MEEEDGRVAGGASFSVVHPDAIGECCVHDCDLGIYIWDSGSELDLW